MEHGGIWRIVTTEDGAAVGPQYATKGELLADLDRYAAEYMGTPDPRDARIAELEGALRTILERSNGYIYNTDQDTGNTFDTDARRVLGEGGAE